MTWKAGLSRYLPALRFFACPVSPSSRGVLQFYGKNYEEIKLLNPGFPMLLRTTENAMPAVTTELDWTIQDLLRFMIQTGRFRNPDGSIAAERVDSAKAYLSIDWDLMASERFKSPGFDPERPGLDLLEPEWKDNENIKNDLATYFSMKEDMKQHLAIIKSGPNDEYIRGENALLMCQRVDLWCAGPKEVERAVTHLYKLGRALNEREVDMPSFISEFVPGVDDVADL